MGVERIIERLQRAVPSHYVDWERIDALSEAIEALDPEERAVIRRVVEDAIRRMPEIEASDIDLGGTGGRQHVWYRVHGAKRPFEELGEWSSDAADVLILSLFSRRQRRVLLEERNLDFSYRVSHNGCTLRLRGDAYFDLGHLALNMRLINNQIYPFKRLGFHPNVARRLSVKYVQRGLVLVTGITGSGKSTTLDSIIDANNRTVDAHIVIISSPIEYVHTSNRCLIRHREVGADVPSFKEGVIQALRQDPDIIMVGEMRDPDTISVVLEAADTGHKVFTTLHTSSAVESLARIIAECPPEIQERIRHRLADVLEVVISQKLPPSVDGKRVLAKEVLLMTSAVRAAIKNGNIDEIYQMIFESTDLGMTTLEQDLRRLVRMGRITPETAMATANQKRRMKELLRGG
jgi:twitching motility protein PilT